MDNKLPPLSRRALHAGSGLGCLTAIVLAAAFALAQTGTGWFGSRWTGLAVVALAAIGLVVPLLRLTHVRGLWFGFLAGVLTAVALFGLTYGVCAYAFRDV
jgi:hypothetical protein